MILRKLVRFIDENELFYRDDKIIVGVSGGVDSVVLLHLLHTMEVECAIAHCNFNLRDDESDQDQEFVEKLAEKYNFPIHKISFDTKQYASKNGISIEMAARDLRYNWFKDLCLKHNYKYIAIGHHADDVAETLFINLCRGTGIHGITGIKPKTNNIIRPLLSLTRKELLAFAEKENIQFREDSTNAETDYVRNKIRHQVLPVLETINPGIKQTILENIRNFREAELIYNTAIAEKKAHLVTINEDALLISIAELKKIEAPTSHLFEILHPYGFHYRDIYNIAEAIKGISGKSFLSHTHQLLRDRDFFILKEKQDIDNKDYFIEEKDSVIEEPISLKIENIEIDNFKLIRSANIASIDIDKIKFPLKLRRWKEGDRFRPLGMKGSKKLSDFFVDQKLSMDEKKNSWILSSEDKIVWVVGLRMDDRYKVAKDTKRVLKIEIDKSN